MKSKLPIIVLYFLIFYLFSETKVHAACPSGFDTGTVVSTTPCTIPAGTPYIIDNGLTESSTTNTANLTVGNGSTITISTGAILNVGTITMGGGSIALQGTGSIALGPRWVGGEADADGYADNLTTLYTATAAGRRRISLMKSKTMADCNSSLYGHNFTLPSSTYYPDSDLDTYTLTAASSGTAICANASTWNSASAISIPGSSSVNASFSIGTRKASASGTADCLDSDANVRTKNATGGTITNITGYRVHTFTSGTSTFTITCGGTTSVEYVVVAGGGSGGSSRTSWYGGGGGGGGGYLSGTLSATQGTNYTATVGSGGTSRTAGSNLAGANGGNSIFSTFTAIGGGGGGQGGGAGASTASSGGSGGGSGHSPDLSPYFTNTFGGSGTSGQGNDGGSVCRSYAGAGGGGAGTVGESVTKVGCATWNSAPGPGGFGTTTSISGSTVFYSAGGSGGQSGSGAASGATNSGDGGGGAYAASGASGAGGSGIVIVRYANP